MPSFDVVSKVDMQEVDNAVNQARKEIGQRYDFKGSRTEIEKEDGALKIISDDEYKVNAVVDVLESKLVKRGVSLKSLTYGRVEPGPNGRSKKSITLEQGIDDDKARRITKRIKESKLKVQAQIQADQVRITGKSRDDLQEAIQLLKREELDFPVQFVNFRD